MKSDNESAISLPVYFKSVKKNENIFAKKTKNKNKRTPQKKKKKFLSGRVDPGPTDVEGIRVIYNATTNIEHPRYINHLKHFCP